MKEKQLKISQSACIARLVENLNQEGARPVYNPGVDVQNMVKCVVMDAKMVNCLYQLLVGSPLYVTNRTRLNFTLAVCQLSRHWRNRVKSTGSGD
ncbi:unnamed protein product [Peronospora belbahrii]|uniref:Uncharacterized protein n=1 Tax=Peronospora belbahrii TaxID=622444 RepID=A0AAU9L4K4_9STRA|nr:unnamed protein product [Peronospora belbahrii]